MVTVTFPACQESEDQIAKAPRRRRIPKAAIPFAIRKVAERYGLEPHVAELICQLACIGQEAA